jgi:hypothetical protein
MNLLTSVTLALVKSLQHCSLNNQETMLKHGIKNISELKTKCAGIQISTIIWMPSRASFEKGFSGIQLRVFIAKAADGVKYAACRKEP